MLTNCCVVMHKNLNHGLHECKWSKETGLKGGSYTLRHERFVLAPTLHFPLKATRSVEEKIYYILFMTHK